MAVKPKQSLMDYMVIGISPALIMFMVGSLMFYLVNVFYQGQYVGRLSFIMAMFVMAIVCIARISMEQGIEYATLFAIPLALVTMVAMARFVQIEGPLSQYSMIINFALIGLVWWSAHKLTWDCTLIDDSQDSSGEGLLQHIGMDGDTVEHQASAQRNELEPQTAESRRAGRKSQKEANVWQQWWQRMVDRRRRPHTPGVWVVYYALAALPLFALGKWWIRDPASQLAAFRNIVVYVGSALGLLLTTSFLGLRRYLRQRSMEMPGDMAGLWLGIGTFLVLALLVFCVLLPRPGASVAISQLPFTFSSPDHQRTHDKAWGNDGPERPDEATRTRDDAQQAGSNAPTQQQGKGTSSQQQQGSQPAKDSQSRASSDNTGRQQSGQDAGQSGDSSSSSEKSDSRQNGQSQSGSQSSEQSAKSRSGNKGDAGSNQRPGQGKTGKQNEASRPSKNDQTDDRQESPSREGEQSKSESESPRSADRASGKNSSPQSPSSSARRPNAQSPQSERKRSEPSTAQNKPSQPGAVSRLLGNMSRGLGALLKLVFWAALLGVLGYFFWKHRQQVLAAIRQLLNDLRDLLAWLLGGRRRREETPEEEAAEKKQATARPFSSYQNPFASGTAQSHSTEQLVRYTFEALEAWAREQRCPRRDEQTPLEFARELAVVHPQLGVSAQQLADLYSRVAYGHQSITRDRGSVLQEVWRHMLRTASLPVPA